VVVFAQLLRRWLKVSLHAAFAMFSAALVWQSPAVFALSLGLAVAVGWSRCELHRHTPREVLVGLLAGAAAGLGFGLLAH
jgi:membrane-associated phospholipid phosphatase